MRNALVVMAAGWAIAGCGNSTQMTGDDLAGAPQDLALADRAAPTVDLSAMKDQAAGDLAVSDQAMVSDQATAPDLATPDLATPDLAISSDLAMLDLAALQDMASPSDLAMASDLAVRDLAAPSDLAMASDLAVRDLAAPSDMAIPTDLIAGRDLAGFGGRLFVSMEAAPPGVWNNASSIVADVAPSFTLTDPSVAAGTRGMTLANQRLFVGTTQAAGILLAFDSADSLVAAGAPAAKIPSANFIPNGNLPPGTDLLLWDSRTNTLWVDGFLPGTQLFAGATAVTSASKAQALFTHPFQQLPAVAYDPMGDRAFLGQISGAGLLAWNGASGAMGSPAHSFVVTTQLASWSMAVDGNALYAIGAYTNGPQREVIAVWRNIAGVAGAKAPDFTMGVLSGIATNDFAYQVTVAKDVLIACIQSGKVLLWTGASTLVGDKMPTQTIVTGGLVNPRKAVLGPVTGRLYVLDDQGVAIYRDPTTAPLFLAKIKMGIVKSRDFALLE